MGVGLLIAEGVWGYQHSVVGGLCAYECQLLLMLLADWLADCLLIVGCWLVVG